MDLDEQQLQTLVAIADQGTFDAAARSLHVTPSAVSQRIRALEHAAGRVLVRRGAPCRPTPAGEVLVQLGRQTRLLHAEAQHALTAVTSLELQVAVNADSLATWFRDVIGAAAEWERVALRMRVEDQMHSHDLLRRGDVLAAVTSEPPPVQGCTVEALGSLRYVAAAAPSFVARWRRGRSLPWQEMPMLVFNEKDALQHQTLERHGVAVEPPIVHQVPSSAEFAEAIRRGLGWGMLPELQIRDDLAAGSLVPLGRRRRTDVPLYWQRWRLDSPQLRRLTDAVHVAARAHLIPWAQHGPRSSGDRAPDS